MKKSTILHLRFPFSFFLLPIFLFASAVTKGVNSDYWILTFIVLHFLIYPASNGYNSYFDKDEGSIGGLKHPPKVSKGLYHVSLFMDGLAVGLAFSISWAFAIMVFIYGLASKAYSHPTIRLKRMPVTGWLIAGLFQGYFTVMMAILGTTGEGWGVLLDAKYQLSGLLASLMLFGSYPMTQIYQHEEDRSRGDITLSIKLGIMGTFYFTAFIFSLATAGFVYFFMEFYQLFTAEIYLLALSPVLFYFSYWFFRAKKDMSSASYDMTMKLNWISAICLNGFFIWLHFS
ncbi:UbiA family prenyltransferase [Marinoscillum sp. MHG1-6]|uniref:UbiA family prenyltransferase n=1 Tax=Marinoscillum sp. MHG1-6 TaxID=2959627 RepID=UPI0021589008|nr:UbiA family prenyltransferase [Marinoscillum sp. MHG1-6]